MELFADMHCHANFADNATDFANAARTDGLHLFSCTVEPCGYRRAHDAFRSCENVRVGLGAHPWWVASGSVSQADMERFCELAARESWIGEIGLDFGARHGSTLGAKEAQLAAFQRAAQALCGGGKIVSLHAVKSADAVMDSLQEAGALEGNTCIFHWFSGSSSELSRAIGLGFFFSVNSMMLSTRRGREYAKAIPATRLLLETDLPEQGAGQVSYEAYRKRLDEAALQINELRGHDIVGRINETSETLWYSRF